jgi:predicted lactoylglutathione lyase
MCASQASKKDVVTQHNNIANSIFGIKSASCVRDNHGFYTKKLQDPDGERDPFY